MTIAPFHPTRAAAAGATDAVADVTSILPTRETVLDRLAERIPVATEQAGTLLILGLLRRDDGWPTPQSTLAAITTLLARSVRGDDVLASSGPAEFVVLMWGPVTAAETVAERLIAAVADLGIPGLAASAGIAGLAPGLPPGEVLRRATLSLTAARQRGPHSVITYREAD
jgi:GGDEF domain-containing protein